MNKIRYNVETGNSEDYEEIELEIYYKLNPGYKGSSIEPPEPRGIEITKVITVENGLESYLYDDKLENDEAFIRMCLAQEDDYAAYNEEIRAEERREARYL